VKLMIASDIHGSAKYCRAMAMRFAQEKADRLLLLGDLLYHGPRNDLPEEYAPKEVIKVLCSLKEKIFCVRGNCDAEVDQMVLPFPILAEYAVFAAGGHLLYAVHGQHLPKETPPLCPGDVLLYGHTHVPDCTEKNGILWLNPGSVSLPKEDSPRSYMTLQNGVFQWKELLSSRVYCTQHLS
jgi:putative phosphoesterase